MVTKELIESILKYSEDNQIPEKQAAIHFDVSPKTLHYYKKKFGIEVNPIGNGKFTYRYERQYSVNDDFFETPNKLNCYWAGFIAADGCIHQGKKQNVLSISLAGKDKDHLMRFKLDVDFEGPVRTGVIKKEYKGEEREFSTCTVAITSQKIADDLKRNFNITERKSLTLLPPNIYDEDLIDSFICGYIDGDGSISLYENHTRNLQDALSISMLGTYEITSWIKNRVTKIVGKECGSLLKREDNKNTFSYTIAASKGVREIFKHFYNLPIPKLERKWKPEIYEYCVNFEKKKPICRRKGVNVFDLDGNLLKHFDTLSEANKYTGVRLGRISDLCKLNDSRHMSKGYMFSRGDKMDKYEPLPSINTKYLY